MVSILRVWVALSEDKKILKFSSTPGDLNEQINDAVFGIQGQPHTVEMVQLRAYYNATEDRVVMYSAHGARAIMKPINE